MGAFFKRWRRLIVTVVAIVVVAAAALFGAVMFAPEKVRNLVTRIGGFADIAVEFLPPSVPPATKVEKSYWLPQRWTTRDRYWFHHTTQGTATFPVPYDWFVTLERPGLSLPSLFGESRLLKDEDYLRRFGFISSPAKIEDSRIADYGYHGDTPGSARDFASADRVGAYPENPEGLPVGFAKMQAGTEPATGQAYPAQLGFTCAACHTGHIEYKNVSIRFDGGPAMADFGKLEKAMFLSLAFTLKVPFRFDRFADRVAERDSRWRDRKKLKEEMETVLRKLQTQIVWEAEILKRSKAKHIDEGFGRLDALNRIGNQVFFEDMLPTEDVDKSSVTRSDTRTHSASPSLPEHLAGNFSRRDAPVSFPPLWSAPWFMWAQYDTSIFNELVRNAGEALGVNAKLNLTNHSDPARPLFRSSTQLRNIAWFEEMLRGDDPFAGPEPGFKGLLAPKWSDAADKFKGDPAWQIDEKKAEAGRRLYRDHCMECHRGPVNDPEFERQWPEDSFWRTNNPDRKEDNWITVGDRRLFNVVQKPVADLGTDRQQSRVLTERQIKLPPELGVRPVGQLDQRWKCGLPAPGDEALNANFALALMTVVDRTIDQWFKDNPTSPEDEKRMRGPRPNCQNPRVFLTVMQAASAAAGPNAPPTQLRVTTVPHYRARPLDGVWATAPYLHNGSVPTLRDMLVPQDQRPKKFCVGSRAFDPVNIGLANAALKTRSERCGTGLTTFDATELGNSNRGHSFEGKETDKHKLPSGVIGPELTDAERDALIAYLKKL